MVCILPATARETTINLSTTEIQILVAEIKRADSPNLKPQNWGAHGGPPYSWYIRSRFPSEVI
jgi:hypothetical protein